METHVTQSLEATEGFWLLQLTLEQCGEGLGMPTLYEQWKIRV